MICVACDGDLQPLGFLVTSYISGTAIAVWII